MVPSIGIEPMTFPMSREKGVFGRCFLVGESLSVVLIFQIAKILTNGFHPLVV